MNIDDFGMDTITLAGPLEAKLAAMREAGFTQVMISARDIAGHPGRRRRPQPAWCARAACASPASRCCATSRACRATCTPTRSTSRRRCCACASRSARRCCSSARPPRRTRPATTTHLARDLRKLAMLAVPLGIRIAYEGLSWGRHVNEYTQALGDRRGRRPPQPRARAWTRSTCSRPTPALDALELRRPGQDLPRPARRLHVAGDPLLRGAHEHRAPLPRVPRRGRAQRAGGRARAPARRDGLPRATTASRCSTTTTCSCRSRSSRSAPRASVKWLTGQVPRRSLPMRRIRGRDRPASPRGLKRGRVRRCRATRPRSSTRGGAGPASARRRP